MKKENSLDINEINHMDISNQIDNAWERDTILSFVNKSEKINYSIRLRNSDKSKLKKNFINPSKTQSAKRHNRKVVNLIFAYMIFKILEEKSSMGYVYICPDHRPSKEVHHYIQKISYLLGYPTLTKDVNLKFMNRDKYDINKKTPADKLAKKIFRGKAKANSIIDCEKLKEIIPKLL